MNDFALYPMLSWVVELPSFTVSVSIDGTVEVLNFVGGVYFGWDTTGAVVGLAGATLRAAGAASLAKAFADTLATHTLAGPVTAYYGHIVDGGPWSVVQAGSDNRGWAMDWNPAENDAVITATSDATALAYLGLQVGDLLDQTVMVNRRTVGVWRPKFAPVAQLEPVMVAVGSGIIGAYDPGLHDRVLFSGRLIYSVLWEYVEAADITRTLLDIANYLPPAIRATGDTAGTLDDVLWTLANGKEVRLALPPQGNSAVEYKSCVMDVSESMARDAYTTEAAVGARRYNVTLALISTTPYDPGTLL